MQIGPLQHQVLVAEDRDAANAIHAASHHAIVAEWRSVNVVALRATASSVNNVQYNVLYSYHHMT